MSETRSLKSVLAGFLASEKAGGIILIFCTAISLIIANSGIGENYSGFWHSGLFGQTVEYWINDGLMAIFFLLIGLELKREVVDGELSSVRNALLPVIAAVGGMVVPAAIYFGFNSGTSTESGTGIPMATDIAFALGVLSVLGSRVPAGVKVFLTALAVIDDLGAILVIAFFYTIDVRLDNLGIALALWAFLFLLNRMKVNFLILYLVGGVAMWYFMLHSGVHATITGVLLALVIPVHKEESRSLSNRLQHWLHKPVAFLILPLFALANTCIILEPGWAQQLTSAGSMGVLVGLGIGKPVGVVIFSAIAIATGLGTLPSGVGWKHVIGAGMLAGIGFTMSIFISLLAFNDPHLIIQSKVAILFASAFSAVLGLAWLGISARTRL